MNNFFKILAGSLLLTTVTLAPSIAQTTLHQNEWSGKKYDIQGSYYIEKLNNGERHLVLSENFKTKSGPDLKIFLSPLSLAEVNGNNAVEGSYQLTELESTKPGQRFEIPDEVDLSKYKTVLIHCEEYSVLWGGAEL